MRSSPAADLLRCTRGTHAAEYLLMAALGALTVAGVTTALQTAAAQHGGGQSDCVTDLSCAGSVSAARPQESPSSRSGAASSAVSAQEETAASAGPASTPKAPRKPFRRALDFGEGAAVDGAFGTLTDWWGAIRDPMATGEGIGYALTHPSRTWTAIRESVEQSWEENPERLAGRGTLQVATAFLVPARAAQLGRVGLAARADEVSGVTSMVAFASSPERNALAVRSVAPYGQHRWQIVSVSSSGGQPAVFEYLVPASDADAARIHPLLEAIVDGRLPAGG